MPDDATLTINLRDLGQRSEATFGGTGLGKPPTPIGLLQSLNLRSLEAFGPGGTTGPQGEVVEQLERLNNRLQRFHEGFQGQSAKLNDRLQLFHEEVIERLDALIKETSKTDKEKEKDERKPNEEEGGEEGGKGGFLAKLAGLRLLAQYGGKGGAIGAAIGGAVIGYKSLTSKLQRLEQTVGNVDENMQTLGRRLQKLTESLGGMSGAVQRELGLREVMRLQIQQQRARVLGDDVARRIRAQTESLRAWEELKLSLQARWQPMIASMSEKLSAIKTGVYDSARNILIELGLAREVDLPDTPDGFQEVLDFLQSAAGGGPSPAIPPTAPGQKRKAPSPPIPSNVLAAPKQPPQGAIAPAWPTLPDFITIPLPPPPGAGGDDFEF